MFDSNSDSDFEMPPIFKSQKVSDSTEERLKRLEDQILSKSKDLEQSIADKDKQRKDAQQRFNVLRQCFECLVCKSPAKAAAVVSPCCCIVLGCEECITQSPML